MVQKICRVAMTLACLIGLTAPAMAGPVAFTCTPGSFLSTLNVANFTGTGPWGEVCVTLTDSTHAFIQAESLSPFVMFSNAFGLEVNSQGFDILGGQGGITAVGVGTSIDGYTHDPFVTGNNGHNLDGFGNFDLTVNLSDGPNTGATLITFTLVNQLGTWANVSSVLAANTPNVYDAAMQIASCTAPGACTGLGHAAEPFANGRVVPQNGAPEPGMLGLLGVGLLAMSLPRLRRRRA